MSDDAQTPEAAEAGEARTSLEKGASLDGRGVVEPGGGGAAPQSGPEAGGPGYTLASNEPSAAWPAPSVHDQRTVTSMPSSGVPSEPTDAVPAPSPWATPSAGANPGMPSANPFAPPGPTSSGPPNPFAPPPGSVPYAAQGEPVPPPPIAPDGPGQVPYGYPGGLAHGHGHGYPPPGPGAPGYYGWPGMQPLPSNGMGTAGLVLGIISAVVFCLWPVAIIVGVLGLIFGSIGRAKARRGEATNPGQALAGMICGAAGVVLGLGMAALVIATS